MNSRIARLIDNGIVLVLLAASLGLNVYLWTARDGSGQSSPEILAVGTTVRALPALDLSGDATTISWNMDTRPTILYVFSPSCIWCKRNMENIAVLSQATSRTHRFIAVSTSQKGLPGYVKENRLAFPVYSVADQGTLREFKFNVTPSTLEISRSGKILHSWAGAYSGPIQNEIEDVFNVRLAGLSSSGFTSH